MIVAEALNTLKEIGRKEDKFNKLLESGTSRIYRHLKNKDWAIVSAFKDEDVEDQELKTKEQIKKEKKDIYLKNRARTNKLESDVRNLGYGYVKFLSSFVDFEKHRYDEESLFIPGMTKKQAMELGSKYGQESVIVKQGDICQEYATSPIYKHDDNDPNDENNRKIVRDIGDVVRIYDLSDNDLMHIEDAEKIFSRQKSGPVSKANHSKPFTLKATYDADSDEHTKNEAFEKEGYMLDYVVEEHHPKHFDTPSCIRGSVIYDEKW